MAPRMPMIAIDTLGAVQERGYGLFVTCLDCARLYRMDTSPEQRVRADFTIDLAKLIEERGAATLIVGMKPLPCPQCGSRRTEKRITTPPCRRPKRKEPGAASDVHHLLRGRLCGFSPSLRNGDDQ